MNRKQPPKKKRMSGEKTHHKRVQNPREVFPEQSLPRDEAEDKGGPLTEEVQAEENEGGIVKEDK